ncbi:alpha/beta hydrolase [uncultured Nocardioides sp.]|uniref:alpha/beta fold hydrolase n=1 Tax=uncultured Nocardioides sp. TaxID=198441 RepID=UPI00262C2345|nr:alpha/beta hydrolase [uncultured Nocardioides sp.]
MNEERPGSQVRASTVGGTHHRLRLGERDGLDVHYVLAGPEDGEPVVLLHGYPQSWWCWRDVVPRLVAAGKRCVVPDLRGLGDTTRPAGGYDKRTVAGDVRALLDHLGIDSLGVVGHDWGGAVAYALAAHFPGTATHLAVVDVAIPGDGNPDIGAGGQRWHHAFLRTLDLPEALVAGREEVWVRWFYETYPAHPDAIDAVSVAEYLRTYTTPGALRAGFAYYRAIGQDVADNEPLAPLDIPCLAVGGGASWGRGSEVEASLSRKATRVRGVVLPDCGHFVPEEKPAELAREVLALLDG